MFTRRMMVVGLGIGLAWALAAQHLAAQTPAAALHETPGTAEHAAANPKDAAVQKQAQLDREWLTAYFLAHQGYRLHHSDALDAEFENMTPSQLRYLVGFYKESHEQRQQVAAQQQQQRQQLFAQTNVYRQQESQMALQQQEKGDAAQMQSQVDQMHQEAYGNYRSTINNQYRPGMYGSQFAPTYYNPLYPHMIPSYYP